MDPIGDEKGEWTRQAIDVMTVWSDQRSGAHCTASRVAEYAGAEPEGAMKLTVGDTSGRRQTHSVTDAMSALGG